MAASTILPSRDRSGADGAPRCLCMGVRGLHVLGYLPGGRVSGLDCEQPLRVRCALCSGFLVWACRAHRASKCLPCSERYRRRLIRVAESRPRAGLALPDAGHGAFLTLTAPGTRPHRRWTPGRRGGGAPCVCHAAVLVDGLGAWNASASACWNRLRTALSRSGRLEYFRAVEVQKRGALHLHVIVWSAEPLDVGVVQAAALAAGFGCVVDLSPLDPARHPGYVAKYATKGSDARQVVPWRRIVQVLDEDTGELEELINPDPSFRTWSASRGWGLTMREIRAAHLAKIAVTRPADAGPTDTPASPAAAPPAACSKPAT